MATVIDSLIVTLGLDSSKFSQGRKNVSDDMSKMRKDSEQTAKKMDEHGKQAASFFSRIRTELIALTGLALTFQGFKNFVSQTANNLSQLGYASQTLGMSAKELDAWEKSFSRFGATSQQVRGAMSSLQNDLAVMRNKGPISDSLINLTGRLGVSLQNDKGAWKSVGDIYTELADKFQKMDAATRQMYGKDLGMSPEMVNFLAQGSKAVSEQLDYYEKMSNATDAATKGAQRYEQQLADLRARFDSTGQKIFTALIPALTKLNELLVKFADWLSQNSDKIAPFIENAIKVINEAVNAVGGWETALNGLLVFVVGKWALGMIGAIGRVGGAIAGLVSNLASVVIKNPWLMMLVPANNTPNQTEENNEKARLAQRNLERNRAEWLAANPGQPLPPELAQDYGSTADQVINSLSKPRGIRNNNPGNLNFAGQAGATKEGGGNGRFAVFGTMADGIAALYRQLQLYFKRGINTISDIVKKYAPASDGNNEGAYISQLTKATGKGANEKLDSSDMGTIFSLMRGIINHENGAGHVADDEIMRGISSGAGLAYSSSSVSNQQATTNEVHIGEVNVNNARNSDDVVSGLKTSFMANPLISTMNGAYS
ncbi:hypothetical protein DET57_114166 [Klebsiella oxytoca]|uniref:Uncharacterized protein n=1 Tax=Klebsiella oxytoca TaxID=571 RepID=A0A318FT52_KLEOX|nr:hypothetical protein [Klebsiella oxytoca]PXW42174.1 hypothetical protein DET57_114166 [Klebsiella oxytoca]